MNCNCSEDECNSATGCHSDTKGTTVDKSKFMSIKTHDKNVYLGCIY